MVRFVLLFTPSERASDEPRRSDHEDILSIAQRLSTTDDTDVYLAGYGPSSRLRSLRSWFMTYGREDCVFMTRQGLWYAHPTDVPGWDTQGTNTLRGWLVAISGVLFEYSSPTSSNSATGWIFQCPSSELSSSSMGCDLTRYIRLRPSFTLQQTVSYHPGCPKCVRSYILAGDLNVGALHNESWPYVLTVCSFLLYVLHDRQCKFPCYDGKRRYAMRLSLFYTPTTSGWALDGIRELASVNCPLERTNEGWSPTTYIYETQYVLPKILRPFKISSFLWVTTYPKA